MARRRFFQISIRTLLILTTAVAIALAYWTRVQQSVRDQKVAAARIVALGGKTKTRETRRVWPWVHKLVGEEFFRDVVDINLNGTLATDADLELIGKLRSMKLLSVEGAAQRHCGLEPLLPHNPKHLPSQISSAGIRRLGPQPNLEIARLARTPITDEAMEMIALWPQLELLDLSQTNVTSVGVIRLGKLKRLNMLSLQQTGIDDGVVPALCQMHSLTQLDIQNTAISGAGLLRLREELPSCKLLGAILDFSAGIDPDPDSMRWKEITRPMWTLSRNGELKLLILAGTSVTDLHLNDLDRLENVDVIDLRRTKVTDAGIATLQRALPNCKIVW